MDFPILVFEIIDVLTCSSLELIGFDRIWQYIYKFIDECYRFADLVLPRLKTFSMPKEQGMVNKNLPQTPLARGIRV